MTDRPILFSGPMVRAILEGRKTQTRRVIRPQPPPGVSWSLYTPADIQEWRVWPGKWALGGNCGLGHMEREVRPAFGDVGDRLWVRESFSLDKKRDNAVAYKADDQHHFGRWQPSIHMPRWVSRITLEVTAIRAERLVEISQQDAISEGRESKHSFVELWDALNSKRGYGAATNPWLWVITFKRVANA